MFRVKNVFTFSKYDLLTSYRTRARERTTEIMYGYTHMWKSGLTDSSRLGNIICRRHLYPEIERFERVVVSQKNSLRG